jgi:hypothetical protein
LSTSAAVIFRVPDQAVLVVQIVFTGVDKSSAFATPLPSSSLRQLIAQDG